MRAGLRLRAAVVTGAVLATGVPLLASATAPHLTCGPKLTGAWERIPVPAFQPVNGIPASGNDTITTYSLDAAAPEKVAVTNGTSVQVSRSNGCAWQRALSLSPTPTADQPYLGNGATIVSVGITGRNALAAVQEGSGAASRPHVLHSGAAGEPGSWVAGDNGLPAQGAPQLLRTAADGRTAYLTISPTATGGAGGTTGLIPGVGGGPAAGTPTGLLYRTTDGGASWTLQTGAGDLPSGGRGFTQLAVDSGNSNTVYGLVGGRLLSSRDGGGTFLQAPGSGYTALAAAETQHVIGFNSTGAVQSFDAGRTYVAANGPTGVTSAAARAGTSQLLVQTGNGLALLEPTNGTQQLVPPPSTARTGSLLGDRGVQASFHALTGHSLLRYVDPVPPGGVALPPIARGDVTTPPPNPGVVTPRAQNVSLAVGDSATVDFSLALPKNPTPLDLFFLVDVSNGMLTAVEDFQQRIRLIVADLQARRVSLKVGVGILGTGPTRGEQDYPETGTYVYPPTSKGLSSKRYEKPVLYRRLRAIGDPNADFQRALERVKLETTPDTGTYSNSEGQLIALKNVALGLGTASQRDERLGLGTKTAVTPGQDAGFRQQPDVRRIVVLASNEFFQAPYGSPPMGSDEGAGSNKNDPRLNFAPTIKILRDNRIGVIGMSAGNPEALPDLRKLAIGTGMLAPAGVSCGSDNYEIAQGDPLVCNNSDNISQVISRVLSSLKDEQSVTAVPHSRTPVLGTLDASSLLHLDVKQANTEAFHVRVTCVDVKPGTYQQDVDLVLRQTVVGRARVNVTCLKANAVVRPRPVALAAQNPPPPAQPAPNPPPPPPAPAPAPNPQPQAQVQTQVQVNPMSAAAMQEQQELQLALALNGTLKDDDPVFNAGQQMAMVDRRKREQVQALGVLSFAVLACAGLGLAGLRARPEIRPRRA